MRSRVLGCGVAVVCVLLACVPGQAQARVADGCRPLRAIFYASTDWLPLAQALAANASPCASYYISVPPLAADKTEMRSGVAAQIRALGPSFHALAEVNVSAWQGWVTSTGSSWYQAGVEARTRMAAAGFDLSAGDGWAVNEFSSAVRTGSGTSRQNMRDLVHGLFAGDGSGPATRGVVFVEGIGQPTSSLASYKANLESWLQDGGFWSDMSAYVSDFLQENYGDIRDYGVAGADIPTRLSYLNAYLEHELQLAAIAPASAAAAQSYLEASSAPLANAAWAWSSGFGYTAVPYDQMEDFVSAQVDAIRSYEASIGWSSDRLGFAWDPSNSLGLSAADFSTETAAIRARLAAAIESSSDPAAPGAGACAPPWCTAAVTGAAFTPGWGTFSTWTPTSPAFTSSPQTVTAGTPTAPISVQLQIGAVATPLPTDTAIQLSSSSPGGSFSTSATGPWTPTLELTVPAGSTSASFYMLDTQAGTPTITAAIGAESTTQTEIVSAAGAPLAIGNATNTVTFDQGGAPVAIDPALTVTDSEGATLGSASAVILSGLVPGDTLQATTTGTNITASYAAGTLSLSGSDTLADYQAVLESVSFSGSASASGTRTILWTAGDGTTTASAITTVDYAVAPDAPGEVTATSGDGQATVSFTSPDSSGGAPITSYTVTSSPGSITATGSASPIVIGGLSNGTTYTFTVTATNAAGSGPASAASNPVTPAPASGGGAGGGGGGGGGGGSSSIALTISPPSQTVASGGAASWTITVTNTGGAYLYAVALSDALAPSCDSPSAYADSLSFMAPNLTITYTCTLADVTASLTNTLAAVATTAPGPQITATATATVSTQSAPIPAPFSPPLPAGRKPISAESHTFATLSVSGLKTVVLAGSRQNPKLSLTVKLSKRATLVLTLLDNRGRRLARWTKHEQPGAHRLLLLLPRAARHHERGTLRITETGNTTAKAVALTLRA